jgi:hypothetical protein
MPLYKELNRHREVEVITVLEIVRSYLEQNGYDGLYDPGECACLKDDLAPCGQIGHSCEPGYQYAGHDPDYDWMIGPASDRDAAKVPTDEPD